MLPFSFLFILFIFDAIMRLTIKMFLILPIYDFIFEAAFIVTTRLTDQYNYFAAF